MVLGGRLTGIHSSCALLSHCMLWDKLAFSADTDENTDALSRERERKNIVLLFVLQVYVIVLVALLSGCDFTDGNVSEGRSGHRR